MLKPGGKLLVFLAAPLCVERDGAEFSRTVDHVGRVLHNGVRLHPPEVSLVRSRDEVESLMEPKGFNIVDYSFSRCGMRMCRWWWLRRSLRRFWR